MIAGLRARFTALLLLVALIPLLALFLFNYQSAANLQEDFSSDLLDSAQLVSTRLDRFLYERVKDLEAESKILILLTDGRNNAGDLTPAQAAEAVQTLGVKIYTIGVGGTGPAPFRIKSLIGTRIVRRQVDLDEGTLKEIADIGGGKYFRATDTKGLAEIYDIIDRAEKTEIKVKEFFHFRELYSYFLIPALIMLGLEIIIKSTILRTVP